MERMRAERDAFAEDMKTAFMRGVCALNMEAMSMFKDCETTPGDDYHGNGCHGNERATNTEHTARTGSLKLAGTTSASGHLSTIPPISLPHHHPAPVMATERTEPGRRGGEGGGGGRRRGKTPSVLVERHYPQDHISSYHTHQ